MHATNSVFRRKNNEVQFDNEVAVPNGDVGVNIFIDSDEKVSWFKIQRQLFQIAVNLV